MEIKVNDFVVFKNPEPDEIWNGEPLRYRVTEIDRERALLEAVTPALHIRPTYRANIADLKVVTDKMTQTYFYPSREDDPYALPDCEVFYLDEDDCWEFINEMGEEFTPGWYWWVCFPGCIPDGDPIGPFDTEEEAIADAQKC